MESAVVSRRDYADSAAFDAALLDTLQKHSIDVVVLAGFLSVLGEKVIAAYRNKIINVHPSLIPSFCGPGFYGLRVHVGLQNGNGLVRVLGRDGQHHADAHVEGVEHIVLGDAALALHDVEQVDKAKILDNSTMWPGDVIIALPSTRRPC